jgi:hypothetical protein
MTPRWTPIGRHLKTLRPISGYCIWVCICCLVGLKAHSLGLPNHMISIAPFPEQGGWLLGGVWKTKAHLLEQHPDMFLPVWSEGPEPRTCESCDFHSLFASTGRWMAGQDLKTLRSASRNCILIGICCQDRTEAPKSRSYQSYDFKNSYSPWKGELLDGVSKH